MAQINHVSGRANTVLVFGHGGEAKAVITTIIAHVRNEPGERVRFTGPGCFQRKTAEHIINMVLPTADGVLRTLNLPANSFDISVVNLGAASMRDTGLNISGFSADLPIFLAMLSASLQMAVPQDIVSTGHIASPDGDIKMVRNIGAKLDAVLAVGSIKKFVHPAIGPENPLDSLSPGERQIAADALVRARRDIHTIAVRDIGELVQKVFSDEQVVLASLRHGFFTGPVAESAAGAGTGMAVGFLAQNNEKRFWSVLGRQLLDGRTQEAKDLLLALAQFHISRKAYPEGLGSGLLRLILSLPPKTRRLKLELPLLPMAKCIQLSQFAKESDHEDVRVLFRATFGEKVLQPPQVADLIPKSTGLDRAKGALDSILTEISAEALTQRVGLPIESARGAYIMDSITVESQEEFGETIAAFYLHLIRHTRSLPGPADPNAVGPEAFGLLERAFARKGGIQAALAEARNPVNGGLRLVLDMMTDQLKREEQEKHINYILKSALDPLDWKAKVDLMGALMKRLEPLLEPEITSQPPERFAVHYEEIIRGYLQSMDRVNSLFRSL